MLPNHRPSDPRSHAERGVLGLSSPRSGSADGQPLAAGLISPSRAGATNRGRVLEVLHRGGPASRSDLARKLGVSRATVATIVQPMIDAGLLIEDGPVASSKSGGKPARPLWFSHDGPLLGSVQIGPNSATAAIIGIDGTIRARSDVSYRGDASSDSLAAAITRITDECFGGQNLMGVGVASSGMVDTDSGHIISMYLTPGFDGMGVGEMLEARLGVPVVVDHHPRVQAVGDRWFGLAREIPDFASVYTGEALGFGIFYRGKVLRGPAGAGGESGHTVVDARGIVCRCGRQGCWETIATLTWLQQEAISRSLPNPAETTSESLSRLAEAGSTAAEGLLDDYARNLAIGMANNELILASGTYIMHGDVCGGGTLLRESLQRWLAEFSPGRGPAPSVMFADTPDTSTLLGGGGLVLASAFSGAA